ncbi:MAG: glycosyltransferase family 4 protein [Bacteroidales bacterium]|nr:glycosyltransferase family 4 protein [Bacteroidales bacterium]
MPTATIISIIALTLISYVLTHYVRKAAIKKSILDNPNERSSHKTPTPRGGGVAIVATWFIGLAYLSLTQAIEHRLLLALLAGIPLAATGLLDDVLSLSPKVRLLVQVACASLAVFFLGGLQVFDLGFAQLTTALPLSIVGVVGMVWFINLYNFIDGIDGYAAMEAIVVSVAMFVITGNTVCLFLAASVLGFLPWNWQRAKIFMGDVGSTMLGFNLAVLGLYFQNTREMPLITWLILTALFWFDASLTILRRLRNKEKLSEAHRKHAYQRIVQAGWPHQRATLTGATINLALIAIALVSKHIPNLLVAGLAAALVLLHFLVLMADRKFPFAK